MIEFEGVTYNALISRRIREVLEEHDPTLADIDASQLETKITKSIFMAAIAKVNQVLSSLLNEYLKRHAKGEEFGPSDQYRRYIAFS